jgi:hypothetical protein
MYHSGLRIAVVVCTLLLVFDSGLVSNATAKLSDNTTSYLANAVGVSVGVAPNEFNQITAALTAREQDLNAREMAIAQREIEVQLQGGNATPTDTSTFILATILFILLVLIILNYTLDFVRQRERETVTRLS